MSLSRIEAEAQRLLQERLHSLRQMHAVPADGPEAAAGQIDEGARAHELREIEEALRRIVDGSYGTCVACGGALGMQRIRAIPEARYCLSCSGQRSAD